ncbi:MAG: hypothetical protein Q7T38_03520 [Gallionella sp.]|nr:hypothetical protein [Gallionella sp.]
MFAKLFGKKSDHPMKDIKRTQALLNDLSRNDAFKLVTELTAWIESVALSEEFRLADQFPVLCLLDETAQPYARKLAYEYFTLPDMNTYHGRRLRQAMGNFYHNTVTAYLTMIHRCCNADKGAAAIKVHLPLMVARAVCLMREQVKYAAAHYGPYDDRIWHHLAQLCGHAEQQQYLDVSLKLYPTLVSTTTVKSEAGQLVAWYSCGINSLNPQSMHLAERLIAQYGNTLEISARPTGKVLFGIDLAHPSTPVRISQEAALHTSMRYICPADMQVRLEALIKILKKNIVPQELNLGGTFAAESVLDAAQHILTYLIDPPVRQNKRLALSTVIDVVAGFENVLGFCSGQSVVDYPSMQWVLENVSSSGFCAVLPNRRAEGLCIGTLLGIQTAAVQKPGVAIVRRMLRDAEGRLQVGVETLANQVSEVTLQQSAAGRFENDQSALWLHSGIEDGTVRLLMQPDTFLMQRSLKTCFAGKNYLMIPAQLQENGLDYDLASFRVIEQEEAEKQD